MSVSGVPQLSKAVMASQITGIIAASSTAYWAITNEVATVLALCKDSSHKGHVLHNFFHFITYVARVLGIKDRGFVSLNFPSLFPRPKFMFHAVYQHEHCIRGGQLDNLLIYLVVSRMFLVERFFYGFTQSNQYLLRYIRDYWSVPDLLLL